MEGKDPSPPTASEGELLAMLRELRDEVRGLGARDAKLRADVRGRFLELLHALSGVVSFCPNLVELDLKLCSPLQAAAKQITKLLTNFASDNADLRVQELDRADNARQDATCGVLLCDQ